MRKPPRWLYIDRMSDLNEIPPRDEEDPNERELSRRSHGAPLGPWVIVGLILMLGALVYVISAAF